MFGYPEVHTNMAFENIPTVQLEPISGIDTSGLSKYIYGSEKSESVGDQIFQAKKIPMHQQMIPQDLLILQGSHDVSIYILIR